MFFYLRHESTEKPFLHIVVKNPKKSILPWNRHLGFSVFLELDPHPPLVMGHYPFTTPPQPIHYPFTTPPQPIHYPVKEKQHSIHFATSDGKVYNRFTATGLAQPSYAPLKVYNYNIFQDVLNWINCSTFRWFLKVTEFFRFSSLDLSSALLPSLRTINMSSWYPLLR